MAWWSGNRSHTLAEAIHLSNKCKRQIAEGRNNDDAYWSAREAATCATSLLLHPESILGLRDEVRRTLASLGYERPDLEATAETVEATCVGLPPYPQTEIRYCSHCGQTFAVNRQNLRGRYPGICSRKECAKYKARLHRQHNRSAYLRRESEYRDENREAMRAKGRRTYARVKVRHALAASPLMEAANG